MFFDRSIVIIRLLLFIVIALGLIVRFIDLTEPPLDFNPTRQLRAAIITRALYYQILPQADPEMLKDALRFKNQLGVYEPSLLERLVAWTYRLIGGEHLWVARIYTIVYWLVGGVALYALARRMSNSDGALIALSFYLFLPFGIFASRSFQPDPFMVMFLILTAFMLYLWMGTRTWYWAIMAGLFGGMAVLVKGVGAFFVAGMAIAAVFSARGLRLGIKDPQVWMMALLMILPAGIYYLFGGGGQSAGQFLKTTLSLARMWISPSFHMRWLIRISSLTGLMIVFLSLIGAFIAKPTARSLMFGFWVGYAIYGLAFPHHITTHDYYHLPLVPIVALSLAPIGQMLLSKLAQQAKIWQFAFLGVTIIGIAYPLWMARSVLVGQNFYHEPDYWQEIGDVLPDDGAVIALTQDYGHRLMYYAWEKVSLWPNKAQQNLSELRGSRERDFQNEFEKRIEGKRYFLITSPSQLDAQPLLKRTLQDNYSVYIEGEGYIIYDLRDK